MPERWSGVRWASAGTLVVTALLGGLAWLTGTPFLFPSLGPTAFLLFASPLQPASCPRNTLLGHLIGVLGGAAGLAIFGLLDAAPNLTDPSWQRIAAAAVALALTSGGMLAAAAPHPPAGATTLIVALGLLHTPAQLVVILVAVALLTAVVAGLNRITGIPYPLWRPRAAG